MIGLGPLEEQAHVENPADAQAGRTRVVEPRAAARAGGRVHGPRQRRRRRGVAVPPLPHRPPARALRARRHLQLERHRRQRDLDRRQGRHGHRHRAARSRRSRAGSAWTRSSSTTAGRRVSGDWQPDSPAVPRAALGRDARLEVRAALPGRRFEAVREAIAPMKLGLWMSPLSFNPQSKAYARAPGVGLRADRPRHGRPGQRRSPDEGSSEAGTGQWGPDAHPARRGAHPRRDRELGRDATSSSTSSSGSTAPGRATSTTTARRSWRCSTGCGATTRA